MRIDDVAPVLVAVCAALVHGAPARACDVSPPTALTIVANPLDTKPPATPTARVVKVDLGKTGRRVGGGDCRDLTWVEFELSSVDDLSAAEAIGYLFESPDVPLYTGGKPLVTFGAGRVRVMLNGSGEAHGPDFDVRIFAVDQAGNVSDEAALLTVRRSEDGCAVGRNAQRGAMWALAVLGLLGWSRKRRREGTIGFR